MLRGELCRSSALRPRVGVGWCRRHLGVVDAGALAGSLSLEGAEVVKLRRSEVFRAIAVLGVSAALTGCASRSLPTQSGDVGTVHSGTFHTADASALLSDSEWTVSAGPSTPPPSIISADKALSAAEAEVYGGFLKAHSGSAIASLVYVTNSTGVTDVGEIVVDRLVWVVQIIGVPIGHSVPMNHTPVHTISTVQWVIDASTGAYIEARDFG